MESLRTNLDATKRKKDSARVWAGFRAAVQVLEAFHDAVEAGSLEVAESGTEYVFRTDIHPPEWRDFEDLVSRVIATSAKMSVVFPAGEQKLLLRGGSATVSASPGPTCPASDSKPTCPASDSKPTCPASDPKPTCPAPDSKPTCPASEPTSSAKPTAPTPPKKQAPRSTGAAQSPKSSDATGQTRRDNLGAPPGEDALLRGSVTVIVKAT